MLESAHLFNGIPSRFTKIEENHAQFFWPDSYNNTIECVNKYPNAVQYCLNSDTNHDPELLIWGDSHANFLYPGIHAALPGKNILMIGQPGCPPIVGVSLKLAEAHLNCETTLNAAFQIIKNKASIDTVIISMMGAAYVNGKRTYHGGLFELQSIYNNGQPDRVDLFIHGLEEALTFFETNNKNVIFFLSTPRLNFDPITCVHTRPGLNFLHGKLKFPCSISEQEFMLDNQAYREIVLNLLKKFPKVKIFDASSHFCDGISCKAIINNELLFRDSDHLSLLGSLYLGNAFKEFLISEGVKLK